MKIFIVRGTVGEYSDRTEWPVRAYTDEAKAANHVLLATAEGQRIYEKCVEDDCQGELPARVNKYDPETEFSYWSAPTYYLESVELEV